MTSATKWGFIFVVIGVAASSAQAQPPASLLLANQYGELCTMCVATLTCSGADNTITTTYDFHKKGFLGQMMTVLDYLPGLGRGVWQTRDVRITEIKADGAKAARTEKARLSMKEAKIEAGSAVINRTTNAWVSASGTDFGTCVATQTGATK